MLTEKVSKITALSQASSIKIEHFIVLKLGSLDSFSICVCQCC